MTLYLIIYVEHNLGTQVWHPLAICASENDAHTYIKNVDTELNREWMAYMELPFYG